MYDTVSSDVVDLIKDADKTRVNVGARAVRFWWRVLDVFKLSLDVLAITMLTSLILFYTALLLLPDGFILLLLLWILFSVYMP